MQAEETTIIQKLLKEKKAEAGTAVTETAGTVVPRRTEKLAEFSSPGPRSRQSRIPEHEFLLT